MSVVTQPFHAVINHLLAREPWARSQLLPYVGKVARLNAAPFSIAVRVAPSGLLEAAPRPVHGLTDGGNATDSSADSAIDVPADVTITVMPDALAAVFEGGSAAMMKHVRIGGDAEFAATLGKLVEHVRWDPEEDLSRLIGDAPAYRLAATVRSALAHANKASRGLFGSLAEYLLDEKPQLVRHRAVTQFTQQVTALRDDVERVEKRLERLERRGVPSRGSASTRPVPGVSAEVAAAPHADNKPQFTATTPVVVSPAIPGIPAMPAKPHGSDHS